jgi:hypothetical protein
VLTSLPSRFAVDDTDIPSGGYLRPSRARRAIAQGAPRPTRKRARRLHNLRVARMRALLRAELDDARAFAHAFDSTF